MNEEHTALVARLEKAAYVADEEHGDSIREAIAAITALSSENADLKVMKSACEGALVKSLRKLAALNGPLKDSFDRAIDAANQKQEKP